MALKNKLRMLLHQSDEALFWLLWVIHLLPIWLFTPFPTVDGPAHLYNARILLELWRGNAFMTEFYAVNPFVQPNVLSHFMLAIMMLTGIPALMAEKLLLTLIVAVFPLAFRRLVHACTRDAGDMVLFVFPFVYGFLFFMGFYNFLLGVVLGLYGLVLWIRYAEGRTHRLMPALIVVVGLLTLFAHLYAFAWYMMFSGLVVFGRIISLKRTGMPAHFIRSSVLIWVLPLLPALYFVVTGQFSGGESHRLSLASLWRIIYEVQPAKGLEYGKANIYTQWIFWLLTLRFFLTVYELSKRNTGIAAKGAAVSLVLLTLALIVLPDGNALAGVVSQRNGLMWFLALLVFLAGISLRPWIKWLGRVVVVAVSVSLLLLYAQALSNDQPVARSVAVAARQVPAGAVVYVENASGRMLHTHVSNYLGATRGLVISDNYQAALPYFPVSWNLRNLPVLHLGEMSKPVKSWPVAGGLLNRQADYVLVITEGQAEPSQAGILANQQYFKGLYALIYQDPARMVSLYRRLPVSIFDL
ncbi:MAG TPA: hypothetical protein PKE03_06215 [Bacteroidales bacterium]|nr:hypothetical protein [Bacteroidales bacterium]